MTIQDVMNRIPPGHRFHWCGAAIEAMRSGRRMPCCCIGCATHDVQNAGFSYQDWTRWQREHRLTLDELIAMAERLTPYAEALMARQAERERMRDPRRLPA